MRWLIALSVLVCGCGGAQFGARDEARQAKSAPRAEMAAETSPAGVGSGGEAVLPSTETLQRKIIYTADVDLVVEDFDQVPSQVKALAKQFSGYIARAEVTGTPGQRRRGQWTLRVPVAQYEDCLAAARELGEVRRVRSDSKDVSEEYFDLEARIRNKKEEEDRLRKHLADSTGKLEDILAVEREISRVRGEVEQMEGRMRVLSNLTTLTTINLSIEEIKDYVPEEAPTYMTRVRRAFSGSISSLVSTGQALSIALVAVAPWLPVLAVAVLLVVGFFKLLVRLLFGRR